MFNRSRVISSSAPNGSSIRSSAGENESARAIETRCCIPPESCHGWWFLEARQLYELEHLADARVAPAAVQPASSSGSEMLRATVRQS